ncbi:MAG: hypothetical protein HYX92_16830 [Chloroflexi bacterium]|nr:hypothetical protein [Chloroflexota bacterium]
MRASAAVERAGVPTVSIVASGFIRQAHAIAKGLGVENLAVAEYPGHPMVDSKEELGRKVRGPILENIIKGLATRGATSVKPVEPEPRDIVFQGIFREVQEFFHQNLWSDGLPVAPPTIEEVERFLAFTDRAPDEVMGVLLPENREATIWNVAVNGVMAGCRPEYMPVLVAVVEAIADPDFRIEDGGSTPGWEPLIILNGPIIKELDFNYGSGVMRVGRQANTSIGRFLRLYMRNVAGLRIPPGATDKGSIAQSFNVVLAENEDAAAEIGWQPFSVDRGFKARENVVTVQSVINISPPCYTGGHTALEHMETIAHVAGLWTMAYRTPLVANEGALYPLFVLSPAVAAVIARDRWTKDDIRQYLYDNVKAEAGLLERLASEGGHEDFSFRRAFTQGKVSKAFYESDDPKRMVPIFLRPEWIGIVLSGDPGRNQSKGYAQNHRQGPPVSKRIELPREWGRMTKA